MQGNRLPSQKPRKNRAATSPEKFFTNPIPIVEIPHVQVNMGSQRLAFTFRSSKLDAVLMCRRVRVRTLHKGPATYEYPPLCTCVGVVQISSGSTDVQIDIRDEES